MNYGSVPYCNREAHEPKDPQSQKMNGIARYVLAGGLIVATAQFLSGPVADWNARREGSLVSLSTFYVIYIDSILKYLCLWLCKLQALKKLSQPPKKKVDEE
jgi:hypothetical protein